MQELYKLKSEMMTDSRALREKCKANIWPEVLMGKYHPRDDYTGEVKQAFTPLFYRSPALEVLIQGYTGRNTIDDGFLSYTGAELDLLPRELMLTAANIKKFRRGYEAKVTVLDSAWLTKQVSDGVWAGIRKATEEKQKLKIPRPEWLSATDYEGEFDMPSIWSTAMAFAVSRIGVEFDFDADELFDTAYLLAMMPAMYGKCHIASCLQGLYLAGMVTKDYGTQAI